MRWTTFLALMLTAGLLAGCADDADADDEPMDPMDDEPVLGDNETVLPRSIALVANATAGEVPFAVSFNLTFQGTDGNTTYVFATGDGNVTRGNATDAPATLEHTYEVAGNFTATLAVEYGNETLEASVNITATLTEEAVAEAPDVTEFSYGESLGCAGDFLQMVGADCISALGGPEQSGIDGFWQALDERYWGLEFTSTVANQLGDSDCFLADADLDVVGEGNNGGAPCMGVVPEGTAWIFLYSYAEPATGQTLTFIV